MKRTDKETSVQEISEYFSRSVAAVLVDFRGMSVTSITDLRSRFRKAGVAYRVVKNNLVRKALEGTKLEGNTVLDEQLRGPTAIAWSFEDPSAAAKIIRDFRKDQGDALSDKLNVKCGVVETSVFAGKNVENDMASLPGKDEVRAQLLAQLLAPAQNLVRQLAAPGQNLAYALDARQRQLGGGDAAE